MMIEVMFYARPDGRNRIIEMTNIYNDDAKFFNDNDYFVSMEELTTGDFVVYARPNDMDEEDEVLVMDRGRTCEETMKELREICEKTF